jgi:hypothetical protein
MVKTKIILIIRVLNVNKRNKEKEWDTSVEF